MPKAQHPSASFLRRPAVSCGMRGFTLIELLAVVAIIGVLSAIVLVVVGKARSSATLAHCMGNQRQVAIAYLQYINNNRGVLAWFPNADQNEGGSGAGSGRMHGDQSSTSLPSYLTRLLEPYGLARAKWDNWQEITYRNQTAWWCPAAPDQVGSTSIKGHGCTYYYYNLGKHVGITDGPARLTALADYLGKEPFLRDYYGNHEDPAKDTAFVGTVRYKTVYAFLDGHVSYEKR